MKQETVKIKVDGVLSLTSNLHISDVVSARFDPNERRIVYNSKVGFPCTLTRTAPFSVPELRDDKNSGHVNVGCVPASSIRGRLRRCASKEIEDHIVGLEQKLTLDAYLSMHCGASKGTPEGVSPALDEVFQAREHPFLGIFGGGPRLVPSSLKVSPALPVYDHLVFLGVIPEGMVDEPAKIAQAYMDLHCEPIVRKDDFVQNPDKSVKDVVENYRENSQQAFENRLKRQLKKTGDTDEETERGVQAISYCQYVKPGTQLYFSVSMDATLAQCGLLLQSIRRFVAQEDGKGLGGKSSIGCGKFNHELFLNVDGERIPLFDRTNKRNLDLENKTIHSMVAAFEEALEKIDANSINKLFAESDASKDKKSDAKERKAATKAEKKVKAE